MGPATDLERARVIERRLRADYGYTLELPDHEVADRWLTSLYAQAGPLRVFRLRHDGDAADRRHPRAPRHWLPKRRVQPITDFWLVRASDAHAWVEAWIPAVADHVRPTPPDPNRRSFAC